LLRYIFKIYSQDISLRRHPNFFWECLSLKKNLQKKKINFAKNFLANLIFFKSQNINKIFAYMAEINFFLGGYFFALKTVDCYFSINKNLDLLLIHFDYTAV